MERTASQTARVLETDVQQVKIWAWLFKDYMSTGANPGKGRTRTFTYADVLVLLYVAFYWEDDPDIEAIRMGLNADDHLDDRFLELLYQHTPILQEPPEGIDESWRHGIFLNAAGVNEFLALAHSYKQTAETLLESALKSGEPREWGYPVLFAYRHTLELYLKIIGEIEDDTHSLSACVRKAEKRHGERFPEQIKGWIEEMDSIDPIGTAFRYADDQMKTLSYAECWIDFGQLKYAMGLVFRMLDKAIVRSGASGRPPRRKERSRAPKRNGT
ncbi:MAG: hypothetical protein IT168_24200 [Bryobacterales bacterium]|nr:hypothetical protein [Bryobacterales bacterium]